MTNNNQITQHITVALMGGDHYARNGIKTLLRSIREDLHIIIIEGGYQELDKALSSIRIDILFISGAEKYHTGYGSLKYLKNQSHASRGDYLPVLNLCPFLLWAGKILMPISRYRTRFISGG